MADATSTSSTSVNLALTSFDALSGVSQVRYSNDGITWTPWETQAATKSWTLTSGDGAKTVYYQIKDNADLTSTTYTDNIIPTNYSSRAYSQPHTYPIYDTNTHANSHS